MLNLSGLLGRGFDNIFDIYVDFAGIMACLLSTTTLTTLYVVLAGSRLLYTVLIPANYSGESPGWVQAIS